MEICKAPTPQLKATCYAIKRRHVGLLQILSVGLLQILSQSSKYMILFVFVTVTYCNASDLTFEARKTLRHCCFLNHDF